MQLSQEDAYIESELSDIEGTIEQHPETAIKRLKSIDVKNIKSKRDKTLYQLLYIQALDLTQIGSCYNYSEIIDITSYCDTQNESNLQMISHYYCGKYNAAHNNHAQAVVDFDISRRIATTISDTAYINKSVAGIINSYKCIGKHTPLRINNELSFIADTYELTASLKSNRTKNAQILIIATIFLCCIIFWSYSKFLKNKEKENMIIVQSTFQRLNEQKYINNEITKSIHELIGKQFESIDNLCNTYYENSGTPKEQKKIYDEVKKQISKLTDSEENTIELEKIINNYLNNLMSNFKKDLPNLKETDYNLYIYSVLGFSARAISLFINEKIEIVYNRKSRLRAKIKSNCTDSDKYLQYL